MDPDHDSPIHFLQLEDFKLHIGSEHEIGIGDRELDLIAEECFEVLHEDTLAGPCPFPCATDLDDMVNKEREEHVARHLIWLAQKSLMGYEPIGPLDYGSAAELSSGFGSDSAQIKGSLINRAVLTNDEDNEQDFHDSGNIIPPEDLVHPDAIETTHEIHEWDRLCDHIRGQKTPFNYNQYSDPKLKGFVHRRIYRYSDSETEDEMNVQNYLKELLSERLTKSGFEKTPLKFMPDGVVDELITEEEIRGVLDTRLPSPDEAELVEYVQTRAKTILAILVYIEIPQFRKVVKWFKKKKYDDRSLPIDVEHLSRRPWMHEFYEMQWRFVAPVFSATHFCHDLDESHILPFVSKAADSVRGSFGSVTKYMIHKNHMTPVSSKM